MSNEKKVDHIGRASRSSIDKGALNGVEEQNSPEVVKAQLTVSESLNVLGEDENSIATGEKAENEAKDKGVYSGSGQSGGKSQNVVTVSALPKIDVMISQTVLAIENELKVKEDEVNVLIKKKDAAPYEVNDLVRRIRFLNGLLSELKRAVKLAEDYVISLWKQFVNKA